MPKASLADYRRARAAALRALADVEPDGLAPDLVRFRNEPEGLVIRLALDDMLVQRLVLWPQVRKGREEYLAETVKTMLKELDKASTEG